MVSLFVSRSYSSSEVLKPGPLCGRVPASQEEYVATHRARDSSVANTGGWLLFSSDSLAARGIGASPGPRRVPVRTPGVCGTHKSSLRAMRGVLPDEIVSRRKISGQGVVPPAWVWEACRRWEAVTAGAPVFPEYPASVLEALHQHFRIPLAFLRGWKLMSVFRKPSAEPPTWRDLLSGD